MTLEDYRKGLRAYLRDYQDLNRILKFEEENSGDLLDLYINSALGFLNAIPPHVITYTVLNFPIPILIIHQATIECLISNGILQARNELSYNNGGVSIKIPDGTRYLRSLQELYRSADRGIKALESIKVSININNAWGGVSSPYQNLSGYSYLTLPSNGLE